MEKPTVRIINWAVVSCHLIPGVYQLHGEVYGHPRFSDGTRLASSVLMSVDFSMGKAETLNTKYELGEPA